jgi:hypothetical protein
MGAVSAVLLAVYLAYALYALASPSTDPQRGMALGLVTFVALLILSVGCALWFGIARKHPWLVRVVFALSVFPVLSQTAQEVFLLLHRAR